MGLITTAATHSSATHPHSLPYSGLQPSHIISFLMEPEPLASGALVITIFPTSSLQPHQVAVSTGMVNALHHPKCLLASIPSPAQEHGPEFLQPHGAGTEAINCNSILGSPPVGGTWEDSYVANID